MKISSVSNDFSFGTQTKNNPNKKSNTSFGSIYIDSDAYIGVCSETLNPPKFPRKDELLFNELAQLYPNQDCFIKSSDSNCPILEFREKPLDVQPFKVTLGDRYEFSINPEEEEYPCVELLLTKNDPPSAIVIGQLGIHENQRSLLNTIRAGFEVHKKLLEYKLKFLNEFGKGDRPSLGPKSVDELSHDLVSDLEMSVKRYLYESAFSSIFDRFTPTQLYGSEPVRIQNRLERNRNLELTTSATNRPLFLDEEFTLTNVDICKEAVAHWPNYEENQERIDKLLEYFENNPRRYSPT